MMVTLRVDCDGLGKEIAKLYSEAGEMVVNISRHKCEYANHNFLADLQDGDEISRAASQVLALNGRLDALINCAGVFSSQPVGHITASEIKRVLDTNIEAAIMLVSRLHNRIHHDGTDIVNVASTAGLKGNPNEAAYVASKWALRGFSATLQTELKDTSSRVISFCPGGMQTGLFDKAPTKGGSPDTSEWMKPSDVAHCLKQLLDLPKNIEVSEIILNKKIPKVVKGNPMPDPVHGK